MEPQNLPGSGMRGISNENSFMLVSDRTGKAVAEVSDTLAKRHPLKPGYSYARPSAYLPTLNLKSA